MGVRQHQAQKVSVEREALEIVGGEETARARIDRGDNTGQLSADEDGSSDHGEGIGGAGAAGDGVVIILGPDAGADAGRGNHSDHALGDGDGERFHHLRRLAMVQDGIHGLAITGEKPEGALLRAAVFYRAGKEAPAKIGHRAPLAGCAGGHRRGWIGRHHNRNHTLRRREERGVIALERARQL